MKKLFFLSCLLVMCSVSVFGQDYTDNQGVQYKFNDDGTTCLVSGYTVACKGDIIIPSTIQGRNVTAIGEITGDENEMPTYKAFCNCDEIVSVTIYEGITSIGDLSFYSCEKLEKVTIPSSVKKIGDAFGFCPALSDITLPEGITHLGASFTNCSSLKRINIPSTVKTLGTETFSGCGSLETVVIPASVTNIGVGCFIGCNKFKENSIICLATTPPTAELHAFFDVFSYNSSSYKELIVPEGCAAAYQVEPWIKSFGKITEASPTQLSIAFKDAKIKAVCVRNWDTNGDGELSYEEAAAVTVLDCEFGGLSDPGYTSFNELQYFTGLTSIGAEEFLNCRSLTSIVLPPNITSIGASAFTSCPLTSISIPAKVTSIATGGTYNINESTHDLMQPAAFNYGALQSISVESGNTKYSSPEGSNAVIETSSGTLVFGCKNTVIPESVTKIGQQAFSGVSFTNTSITLPVGVGEIHRSAFYGSNITSVNLGELTQLTAIGSQAFGDCLGLSSVTIPSGVSKIEMAAFVNCENLENVVSMRATPIQISSEVFGGISDNATLTVPVGSISAYKAADYWKEFKTIKDVNGNTSDNGVASEAVLIDGIYYNLNDGNHTAEVTSEPYEVYPGYIIPKSGYYSNKNITIPASVTYNSATYSVTSIGEGAFSECVDIENVQLPEGLLAIEDIAFFWCSDLKTINIPTTVTRIGRDDYSVSSDGPFKMCTSLKTLRIPASVTTFGPQSLAISEETTVIMESSTPPELQDDYAILDGLGFSLIKQIVVPNGSKSAYQSANVWKEVKDLIEELPATEPITFGEKPITTYTTSYNMDFSGTDEIKAYVATGYDYDSGTVWLTRVKDVPAGMPVMIMGTPKETYDIPVNLTSGTYFKNMFVANTTDGAIYPPETSGEMTNYYLSSGIFKTATGTNAINPGKCYLQIPTVAPTPVVGSSKDVTLNKDGYASFCGSQDLDFTDVEGLKAYAATGYDDVTGTIWLTRVKRVSAGTGLLLMGAAEGEYTIPSTSVRSYYANMMVGNTSSEPITIYTTSGDMTNYYLSGNMLLKAAPAGTIGNPINPGKAYMQIPSAHVTRSISDDPSENLSVYDLLEQPEVISMQVMTRGMGGDGDTTGIRETMQPEQINDVYYNLNGQRVDHPVKGLYIRNGKVIVIK